ncbi:hypothetical protein [Nonomuraea sp. NPDC049400]|uniref:hypothetical protein n=1 Tax=Nonomuraea sp. NPDC049400 TaxID=3364352 RepID=UPI0037ACE6AE
MRGDAPDGRMMSNTLARRAAASRSCRPVAASVLDEDAANDWATPRSPPVF